MNYRYYIKDEDSNLSGPGKASCTWLAIYIEIHTMYLKLIYPTTVLFNSQFKW